MQALLAPVSTKTQVLEYLLDRHMVCKIAANTCMVSRNRVVAYLNAPETVELYVRQICEAYDLTDEVQIQEIINEVVA